MSAAITPLSGLSALTAEMQLSPRMPRAQYSEGPNWSATEAKSGVTVNKATVAMRPPIAEQVTATPRASPASPRAVKW